MKYTKNVQNLKLTKNLKIGFAILLSFLIVFGNLAYVFAEGTNTIYVNDFSTASSENGTEQAPYKEFRTALNRAQAGDTIVLLGTSVVRTNSPDFLRIDKPLTIEGRGGQQTLSLRGVHLQFGANLTVRNINLSMVSDGTFPPILRVQGGQVTFDNVSTVVSAGQANEKPNLEILEGGNFVEENGSNIQYKNVKINTTQANQNYTLKSFEHLTIEQLGEGSRLSVDKIDNLTYAPQVSTQAEIHVKNIRGIVNINKENTGTLLKLGETTRSSLQLTRVTASKVELLSPNLYLNQSFEAHSVSAQAGSQAKVVLPMADHAFTLDTAKPDNLRFELTYFGGDLEDYLGKVIYTAPFEQPLDDVRYEFKANPGSHAYVLRRKVNQGPIDLEFYRLVNGTEKPEGEDEEGDHFLTLVSNVTYVDEALSSYRAHFENEAELEPYNLEAASFVEKETAPDGSVVKIKFYLAEKNAPPPPPPGNTNPVPHKRVYEADDSKAYNTRGLKTPGRDGYTEPNGKVVPPVDEVWWVGTEPRVTKRVVKGEVPTEIEYRRNDDKDFGSPDDIIPGSPAYHDVKTTFRVDRESGAISEDQTTYLNEVESVRPVTIKGTKPTTSRVTLNKGVRYVADPALTYNDKQKRSDGQDGFDEFTTSYELNTQTGQITERREKTDHQDPENELYAVGTMPRVTRGVEYGDLPTEMEYRRDDSRAFGTADEVQPARKARHDVTITFSVNESDGTISENAPTYDNEVAAVRPVTIKGTQSTRVEREIEAGTDIIRDASRPEGETVDEVVAENGSEAVITHYDLNPQNGTITSREETQTIRAAKRGRRIIGSGANTPIPFDTIYEPNESLDRDVKQDKQPGRQGLRNVRGEEIEAKQDHIIYVGTKPVEETVSLPKTERYEGDETQAYGDRTTQEGRDGFDRYRTTYTVNPQTGATTPERTLVDHKDPVEMVHKIGTMPRVETGVEYGEVPTDIEYRRDDQRDFGTEDVVEPGRKARRDVRTTYRVNALDGTVSANDPIYSNEVPAVRPVTIKGTKTKVEERAIVAGTDTVMDPNVPEGEERLDPQPQNGLESVTTYYDLDERTGHITSREETREITPAIRGRRIVGSGAHTPIPFDTIYERNDLLDRDVKQEKQSGRQGKRNVRGEEVEPKQDRIIYVGTKPLKETETLPKPVRYVADVDAAYGSRTLREQGSDGSRVFLTTYEVDPQNGTTTATRQLAMEIKPVTEVYAIGTMPRVENHVAYGAVPTEIEYRANPDKDYGSEDEVLAGQPAYHDVTTTYRVDENSGDILANAPTYSNEVAAVRPVTIKGTKPVTVEREIVAGTDTVMDPAVPEGEERLDPKPQNGLESVTTHYDMDPITGIITSREERQEIRAAIRGVRHIGSGANTPIPFDTIYEPNESLDRDVQKDKQAGIEGLRNVRGDIVRQKQDRIIYVGTKPLEEREELPKTHRFEADINLAYPERRIEQGRDGYRLFRTTYAVNPKTGATTPNKQEVEHQEPVAQVTKVGTKPVEVRHDLKAGVRYVADPEADFGTNIKVAGQDGREISRTTYTLNAQTGEVSATTTTERVEPQDTVYTLGTKTSVKKEDIAIEEEMTIDTSKPKGYREVLEEGEKGEKEITIVYKLDVNTGKISKEITERVIKPMKKTKVLSNTIEDKPWYYYLDHMKGFDTFVAEYNKKFHPEKDQVPNTKAFGVSVGAVFVLVLGVLYTLYRRTKK